MTECERLVSEEIIDKTFFEEEVRDGFLVDSTRKKVWAIELDLLRVFDLICKEHNLRFWAGFGTLLGAVRHRGFIPWDDDLDVWMPRDDYDKLLSLDLKLDKPYFLQTTLNDVDYYNSFARLRNSNTTGVLVSKNNSCNNGIYLDVIPLDGMNKNRWRQIIRSEYIRCKNVVAHAYTFNINPSLITRAIHRFLHLPFIPYSQRKTYVKVNAIAKYIDWDYTDNVGIVVYAPYAHEHNLFEKKDFLSTAYLPFENTVVPVPFGYDNILRIIYGDYTKFPPVEKRGAWHDFEFEPDIPYYEYLKEKDIGK